jgi:hypothetical protein
MRLEYKYLIAHDKIDDLREAIRPFVNLDEYTQNRSQKEYTVRSIYFDTMRFNDYHDKLAGLKVRKKLRIRGYNELKNESIVFLEVKRKYGSHISKNRASVLHYNLEAILRTGDIKHLLSYQKKYPDESHDANKFFYLLKIKNNYPIINVVYEREAFFSKLDSTLRITFDKNLRSIALPNFSELFSESGVQKAMNGHFILEIKFYNGFPVWLQKILSEFGSARTALSKYTICIDNHIIFDRFKNSNKLLIPRLHDGSRLNYKEELVKDVG